MELSPRLRTIAQKVPNGARLADIGTDHAYLPVFLIREGKIPFAIASDLREGPLQNGRAIAKQWQIPPECISFRCSDGLLGIKRHEVDTIVLAGMGGDTIAGCLNGVSWSRDEGLGYILQPMSSIPELRVWLQENGFRIEQESLAKEQEKLYVVMQVQAGEMAPLTLGERWVGRQSPEINCPHRSYYISDTLRRRKRALDGMEKASQRPPEQAMEEIRQTIMELEEMSKEWLSWQQ